MLQNCARNLIQHFIMKIYLYKGRLLTQYFIAHMTIFSQPSHFLCNWISCVRRITKKSAGFLALDYFEKIIQFSNNIKLLLKLLFSKQFCLFSSYIIVFITLFSQPILYYHKLHLLICLPTYLVTYKALF